MSTPDIKMVDLRNQYLRIKPEVDKAMQEVLERTDFINGNAVNAFAEEFAVYNQVNYSVPCGNCTDGLQIAMIALGLKPGDEVVVPVHTYVATAEVIALLKLSPVFVDVDPENFTIDIEQFEKSITNKTKAVVPVHLYGQCADMEPILNLAEKHNLFVIEDTAQAIGAEYSFSNGEMKKAGSMGNIGATSFYPSKNLGAFGDGGALMINDEELAKTCKMIGNHGQIKRYHYDLVGCNSRLDSIQAAILRVKLKYLDEYSKSRMEVAAVYDEAFKDNPHLTIPKRVHNSSHVFHQYTLKTHGIDRDLLKKELLNKGVPSMIYYAVPLHLQKAYLQYGKKAGSFPISEDLSKRVISLPIHTEMKKEDLAYIIETVSNIIRKIS